MKAMDEKLKKFYEELVPDKGKAPTKGGEVVRAYCHIAHAFKSKGTMVGHDIDGEYLCSFAAYLYNIPGKVSDFTLLLVQAEKRDDPEAYSDYLKSLKTAVVCLLEGEPGICRTPNIYDSADLPYDKGWIFAPVRGGKAR